MKSGIATFPPKRVPIRIILVGGKYWPFDSLVFKGHRSTTKPRIQWNQRYPENSNPSGAEKSLTFGINRVIQYANMGT